jgi:hypothetical protein
LPDPEEFLDLLGLARHQGKAQGSDASTS